MKKIIVLVVLGSAVTGYAAAGGLDFHLGAGYHSSYYSKIPSSVDELVPGDLLAMPLGIGGYVGIGYGFGGAERKQFFNMGIEAAPSWDFAVLPPGVSNFALQGRAYFKFQFAEILTLTAFGGFGMDLTGSFDDPGSLVGRPVFGARVTVLFIYAEYAATMPKDFSSVAKHEVGLGIAIFR